MKRTFCCGENNDLYRLLNRADRRTPRYGTAEEAIERAEPGSAVLVLADGYPDTPTVVTLPLFERAARRRLRLYVEYPAALPGLLPVAPISLTWERIVVASDGFGPPLPKGRILAIHDCRLLPVAAANPLLAAARVAGFDTAVFGLPERTFPLLFEAPGERRLLVATTKLSDFLTARLAPTAAWKAVWEHILAWLEPGDKAPALSATPTVRPAFGPDEPLPSDVERRALRSGARWYREARLLVPGPRVAEIHQRMRAGAETRPVPPASEPAGDGAHGILEGFASAIRSDGSQDQRLPLRADCNAESAMVLALEGGAGSRRIAANLLDYVYRHSEMHGGVRADPAHPAFGLIAWGAVAPLWQVANYGDDQARVLLATMVASVCLKTDRWDASMLRALLANQRVTGTNGFQGDRIDIPDLERRGWAWYARQPTLNFSPHFESYLWACKLWAYRQTRHAPFLEKTRNAIRRTMEAYPSGWRWKDSLERARMLLCLAWLVRLEDTAEHRRWLRAVAGDLLAVQQPCGALAERLGAPGTGGHYQAPTSNEAYGTQETPLIQQNGDPASDQLYTAGFALLGLHEAAAATGERSYAEAEERLARYLCRIQIRSERLPYLNGAWFRAFDFRQWDYWASSADIGWGAWCIESGWGQAWTLATLALRAKGTALWDLTAKSRIAIPWDSVQEQMAANRGDPWRR